MKIFKNLQDLLKMIFEKNSSNYISLEKKVLELNINEINKTLKLGLSIKYKKEKIDKKVDEKFYIINNFDKIIYKKSIFEVNVDFESQRKLMLDILYNIVGNPHILNHYGNNRNEIIPIYKENYIDVLGKGVAYKDNFMRLSFKKYYNEKFGEFETMLRDFVIKNIRKKLNGDKIRVVYAEYSDGDGFYVYKVVKETNLKIFFVDNLNNINFDEIIFYYHLASNEDLKEAMDFIAWQIVNFYYNLGKSDENSSDVTKNENIRKKEVK